ncbi:MAG: hypothetical protein AMS27_10090 [Bacteroides sp. SM23_62_1]|nr:MAG: hypothetical protein AMS27_10090 [Bacteroides sp. SM23_62_1]
MKNKLLLLLLFLSFGVLQAQDTIKTLLITEARMDRGDKTYVEITNMGTDTVNLSDFEFGTIRPWASPWEPEPDHSMMLPDHKLPPGKSYVIACFSDYNEEQYAKDVADHEYSEDWTERLMWPEMYELADLQIHRPESPTNDPTDSVTMPYHWIMDDVWNGRECWYLRHHISETDSAVIDQVGGVFDATVNDVPGRNSTDGLYDVAGVTGATGTCVLIRKFSEKEGNLDFDEGRGKTGPEESEWIAIPFLQQGEYNATRQLFWTVGNHGDYNLDNTTLTSSTITIDWTDSTLSVPWGIRRDDSIMFKFDRQDGFAWHYDYVRSVDDSAYVSIRTGDILTVYACGNDMDKAEFEIEVEAPGAGANIVIPKRRLLPDDDDWSDSDIPFTVTDGIPGMDTIEDVFFGTRVDTLFKYLEKAPNASWEIVFVDGVTRPDLKMGDKLKVTAEDLSVKEYYIKIFRYRKSTDASLRCITWPDIPDKYRDLYGWNGDTIPNFAPSVYDYIVQVPYDVPGVPALVVKKSDENARVEVARAKNIYGAAADRTVKFTVTAEDDTSINVYSIRFEKEKNPVDIQPWEAEPIISEFIFWEMWTNGMIEICNPGTVPLDLSDYMFYGQWNTDPSLAISSYANASGSDWLDRYVKYIPGYKWAADSAAWKDQPAMAIQDLAVNPIVQPGDVFVMSSIWGDWGIWGTEYDGRWPAVTQADVIFHHTFGKNTWDEVTNEAVCRQWTGADIYVFKILNDSIKQGLKAATDPRDFDLIETFGHDDGSSWTLGGKQIDMITTCIRKPEYYLPKDGFAESFGTTPENSEWILMDRPYFDARGVGWPMDILLVVQDLGKHTMDEVTFFKSTVRSIVYKVSPGYSLSEQIRGVITGTTVNDFTSNIIKSDEEQTFIFKNGTNGNILFGNNTLANGDTLIVVSADYLSTTKYILEVTDEGLSDDALLTSDLLTIEVDGDSGTISGFEYGMPVMLILDNVTAPPGAKLEVIDGEGTWVPMMRLNFDTVYVDVQVTDQIFFEVTAEDGKTVILYQLMPDATASDAFVTSDVFMVQQNKDLIYLIPIGTSVGTLFKNLTPAQGATMKLIDKLGFERTTGEIYVDDQLVVTSKDSTVTRTYSLSLLPSYIEEEVDYFPYVTSTVYIVDQFTLDITGGIYDNSARTDFLDNLVPSPGATVIVVDTLDVENTGATLRAGDLVKVTAANGVTSVYYAIDLWITSVDDISVAPVQLYPNPASGKLFITGLERGYRIQIYNILGAGVRDIFANNSQEEISLEDQPAGVYVVIVSNNDAIIGRYKLILK